MKLHEGDIVTVTEVLGVQAASNCKNVGFLC